MQMQASSFEMKLSNLQGDKIDLLNLSPNHRNSLPSLFDPVLLIRTEPVGQDLSKSYRSLSAPISTAKVNEVTNQTIVSPEMKDDITSSLDPILTDSLTDQKIQYQIKDDHLDGNTEISTNATNASRSIASSTNATGFASNLSSVTDYMSVNDRLKLLPLTSNTVKDNERIDEDLVDAQENTGNLFAFESYSESRDRFLLLEDQSNNNTVFSASNKVSMTHRSEFDPCIRENSAPVGSESNGQSLNPGAVHLSFSDSDEELTNSQALRKDFDYSLPIAEQERLLPTGADSEFLEREAKSGRIKKSKYVYRAKNKISDLDSDQPENISEEVNTAQLPNTDILYSTNANRHRTTTEHELIEVKGFTRLNPDVQGSTDDISKSVDKSNIISQSLDSLNINNHATFDDIRGLTKSFAAISNQVDQIKASIDLNKQILKSRSSNELEKEDCVTKRFLQNSVSLERDLSDTSERFIYGSESSFKIPTNLAQPKSSLTSLLQPKDSSGNVDTEEDDTDELIRMASKLVESYSKDISDDSNQTHSPYSPHSVVNTDTSKQTHAVSREKNDSRLSNILTESGRGTMPSSEGIVTPPQTDSTSFQNMNSSYARKQDKISPSKKDCCKQNENATAVDSSNSFLETNLASRNHSSNSAEQEKTSEVFPNKTNYKQKRLISTSAVMSENLPNITLSSSSSKDYTAQYDSNSSRLFDYDVSQDSDSLGRQVNNLLSRTAYLECKTSTSAHFKSDVLHQSSHDKLTSPLLYANTSINSNKISEISDGTSAKSQDTSFSQLKQDLIDLQHDLNENLSIEKKQLGISDSWSPLKNLSTEDSFIHSDKDLIDFNEPRLPIEDNQGSSGLMPNSDLPKFDFKNLSPSEKNTSLSLPLPLANAKEEKKTFESLHLSWQNEDTSLKNVISFKEFFKCSGSSKNDNQKLQNKSYSTSFSSSQSSNIPNSSSNQSPYNQPPANDSLELKDDLSLRVERLLSKESSYDIPKMSCLQNVRPKEGFFPKASFELNSSSETETEPRLMEDKSSTIMPRLDKKVENGPLINQTASIDPPEDFDYFDPLLKSNTENKVQNVSKEPMKINSLNESLQKPNFNQPLIQGLKAPDNYAATSLTSKITNVSQLITSGLHSKSNNDFTGVNSKNNNSKPVDVSSKDSLYATGDLKRPEDIIRNQLNSPNSETNEVFQNPTCDSLNSTKFPEDDVRKCLDWSNMTDFDSPAKERCQDTNTKHSTLFLSKTSLPQTFNNFDMLNPEPFPRSQENNSKNYSLSNSKSNLPNKPAYLSTFKETVPNHSATCEDSVDYEFLKPKASPTMLQHTELNSNDNSSGNITNKILDKYQSPILHRSESFQKSSFLNQSLNADPSVRPQSSINRSHSLEEFQKQKVSSLPQKRNTYRTKPRNSSEMLSSSSDSDSLKRDLHKLSVDLEQDYERSVKHSHLTCSLPTNIGMASEQISVGVSPKNQYPYSLPASLNTNRSLLEFYNGREDSHIHSLLSKYELPMERNVGSNSNNFSHKISTHNSITAPSGDGLCINSRHSKISSDATGQSNKFEPKSNTVDAVLLDNLSDSEEVKDNQESADVYHSSSCDPRETSSQSKLNPSPSGSDSSTLSQKTWTLRPYKPPGSQDWYYTGASGFPPFSVSDSGTVTTATTTTMESGDTGSDDAIGPHIQKEFLGSRPDGPSIPGIYSRAPGKKKSNTIDNPLLSTIQERSTLNDKDKIKTKTKPEVTENTSSYRETRRNWVDSQDTYSRFDSKKLSELNYPNELHHTAAKVDYVSSDRLDSFRKNPSSKEQFDHTKNKGCQRYRNVHDEGLDFQCIKHKEPTMPGKQRDANSYKQSSFESVTTVETPSDFSTDPESATSSSKTIESSHFVSRDSDTLVLTLAKNEETGMQQAWGDLTMTGHNLPNGEQVIFRSDMHVTYKPTEPAKGQLSRSDSYSQRISRSAQELDLLWQKFKQQAAPPSPENSVDSSRLEQIQHLVKNPTQALVRRSINLLEEKRQQQSERAEQNLELQKQSLLKQKLQEADDSTQSSVTSGTESVYSLSENVETMSASYWPEERHNGNIVYSGSIDPMIAKLRAKIEKQRQKCELMKKRDKASEEKLHKLTSILVTRQMNDLILASEMNSLSTTSTATCMSNSTMESVEQSSSKKAPVYSQYCGKCGVCNERLSSKPRHSSRLKHPKRPHRITATNLNSKNTARSTESKFGTSSLTAGNSPSKYNVKSQSTETQPIGDGRRFMAAPTFSEVSEKRKPVRKVIPKQDATTMVPSPLTVCETNLNYSACQEDTSKVSVAVQTSPCLKNNAKYQTTTECTPSYSKTSIKPTSPGEIQIVPKSCPAEDLKVIPVPFMWTPKKQKSKNRTLHSADSHYSSQQRKLAEKDKRGESWFVSLSETNISRTDHNCRASSTSNCKRTQRHSRSDSADVRKVCKHKEQIPVIFNNSFDSHSFSSRSNKPRITLQEAFQNYMPNWISRSRERQKRILLAAQERRYQMQMEMERNKIFQNKKPSTTASENDPICENLYKPKKRAFSKQEMKELNWKLYRNLPEVISQKVEQTRKIQYKCNKTKSRVFSMKVQKNILNKVSKKI